MTQKPGCFGDYSESRAVIRSCVGCSFVENCFLESKKPKQTRPECFGQYKPCAACVKCKQLDECKVSTLVDIEVEQKTQFNAADILQEMADTFRERNAVYGDNYKMVAPIVAILFPKGVPSELVITHQWHLFELMLVKISRFAVSNLTHQDSIHDTSVYGAMIEAILKQGENNG